MSIGVLVPLRAGDPGVPRDRPIGRAALKLADEGIDVVFGHAARDGWLIGHRARPDRWEPTEARVSVAFDRYPSQTDPDGYAALRAHLPAVPVGNPMSLTLLCRDKLETQRVLGEGVRQPPVEADPTRFEERLAEWGVAYLKPRFGAFGRGVRRVTPGDPLPARGEGSVPGVPEPLFLQRAVPPLPPWRGVACRVLAQRTGPTAWWTGPPVVRRSRDDWVVNAARGAEVVAARTALPDLVEALQQLAIRCAQILAAQPEGDRLVEIGADAVIRDDHTPLVVEVNSRPRGRLEALADLDPEAFFDAHVDACCRPLRYLAALHPE